MSPAEVSGVPPGYVSAAKVATDAGRNPEVLKRRLRDEPGFAASLGARKIAWRGRGLWVVPEGTRMPPDRRRSLGEGKGREVARRAHEEENKAALARDFGINRWTVYELMDRYPADEFQDP